MRAYIIRRLLLIIPTLFILTILVFFSVRFIPGDAIDAMLGKVDFQVDVDREALARMLGLDVPAHVQYGRWMGGIFLHGTLGTSLIGGGAVEDKIIDRLPVTIELGVLAIVIGLLIALPVGIYSAIHQDTAADYVGRSIAIIGLATPNFWLANYGHNLPGNLVGLVAADGSGFLSPKTRWGISECSSFPACFWGRLHGCSHNAADAHHDAGGAQAGLYQDRVGQGSQCSRVVVILDTPSRMHSSR